MAGALVGGVLDGSVARAAPPPAAAPPAAGTQDDALVAVAGAVPGFAGAWLEDGALVVG